MIVTETKRIRYDTECRDNPVFLSWLNTLGGWQHWLFSKTQNISYSTSGEKTFEPNVTDLETSEGFEDVLGVDADKGMILGANGLDRNDIEFIKSMLYSVKVQMLTNNDTWTTEGCKWLTVIADRGRFNIIETGQNKFDISLTIKVQRINTQKL